MQRTSTGGCGNSRRSAATPYGSPSWAIPTAARPPCSTSGSHERVGNYSGVTVDAKEGRFEYKGYHFVLVDLPGTYSLSAYSPEELYVRKNLIDNIPDVVINVVDASNLERNLYLTAQIIDMNLRVVMAMNMYDEPRRQARHRHPRTSARHAGGAHRQPQRAGHRQAV